MRVNIPASGGVSIGNPHHAPGTMRSKMLRIMFATGLFIAALGLDARPAAAYVPEGPWCATVLLGNGSVAKDCHFRTFAACAPTVLAGNRGFCGQNPGWAGWYGQPEPSPRHSRRHAAR
jgi:hypothetical protein